MYKRQVPITLSDELSDEVITATAQMNLASGEILRVEYQDCLLYTSDAADERSSVDLGGRRIIKKKKTIQSRTVDTAQK